MTPIETPSPDPDALGRDLGAVRRLARGLVAGDDLADDVVQETVIVALRRGGDRSRSAAAWLAGIARNVARNLLRAGRRRARHEAAAHPARPAPSVLEDAARIEEHRRVLAAARDLTEPYRSVVILRFFDDLTPTAIAALTGRAVPTVKTQLRRALAHMRRRLDTESEGKRDRWVRGLLPLLPLPGVASTTVATGTAAVAAAALALAFFLPARDASRREDGEVPAPQATVLSSAARLASRSIGREEGAGADREGPDGPRSEIDIRVDASGVGGRLPAHVFLRGRALARVALPLAGAGVARATSLAPGSYAAWVEADGVTASAATFSIPYLYDYPPVLHLSSAVGLTVKVVDAVRASPVAGARVEVVEAREGRGSPAWSAVTDSDGLARLSAVPVSSERSPRFRVAAFARGFEAAERVVCLQADASRPNEVVVALSAGSVVVGSARTARAEPVPDALVVALPSVDGLDPEILWRRLRAYSDDLELIGEEGSAALPSYLDGSSGESTGRIVPLASRSDALGRFTLTGARPGCAYTLLGVAAGFPRTSAETVLSAVLGAHPVTVTFADFGRAEIVVLGPDGAPLAAPTAFGATAGWRREPGRLLCERLPPGAQTVAVGGKGCVAQLVRLDVVSGAVARALVRLERGFALEGVVVDARGTPVAGATVGVDSSGDRTQRWPEHLGSPDTVTGDDGTFAIDGAPPGLWTLHAMRRGFIPRWDTLVGAPGDRVTIVLERQAERSVRVHLVLPPGGPAPSSVTFAQLTGLAPDPTELRRTVESIVREGQATHDALRLPWTDSGLDVALRKGLPELMIVAEGFAPETIPVGAGDVAPVSVVLGRARLARGRVVDDRGRLVSDAVVCAYLGTPAERCARTDADGGFALAGIGPPPLTLWSAADGCLAAVAELDRRWDGGEIELRLERGTAVTGIVRGRSPTSSGPCVVEAWPEGESRVDAKPPFDAPATGDAGRFRLAVRPGRYLLLAREDEMTGEATVDVSETAAEGVVIDLRPRTSVEAPPR